jgi:muconolactone delta-isomerase
MEYLVEFDVAIPDETPGSEVKERADAEAAAAARLAREGHLVRLWKPPVAPGETKAVGVYRLEATVDGGDVLYVQSRGVRHRSAEVLARLGRGENVDASEYTFRTSTQIETAASGFDWLDKGVFISVGGRRAGGVVYETYLVQ